MRCRVLRKRRWAHGSHLPLALTIGAILSSPGSLQAQPAPVPDESACHAMIGNTGGVTINNVDDVMRAMRGMGFEPGLPERTIRAILLRFGEDAPQGASLEELQAMLEIKAEEYQSLLELLSVSAPADVPSKD